MTASSQADKPPSTHHSEIALLLDEIEAGSRAAWQAMYAPAVVGKHSIIDARQRNLSDLHQRLTTFIGEGPADEALTDAYNKADKAYAPPATEPPTRPKAPPRLTAHPVLFRRVILIPESEGAANLVPH